MPFVYAESEKTGNDKGLGTKQILESILKSSPSGIGMVENRVVNSVDRILNY